MDTKCSEKYLDPGTIREGRILTYACQCITGNEIKSMQRIGQEIIHDFGGGSILKKVICNKKKDK